ncbi:hypothetical protein ACB092_02G208400 [Castanea dentata]
MISHAYKKKKLLTATKTHFHHNPSLKPQPHRYRHPNPNTNIQIPRSAIQNCSPHPPENHMPKKPIKDYKNPEKPIALLFSITHKTHKLQLIYSENHNQINQTKPIHNRKPRPNFRNTVMRNL